jgi:hypothetical protein
MTGIPGAASDLTLLEIPTWRLFVGRHQNGDGNAHIAPQFVRNLQRLAKPGSGLGS